MPGALRRPPGSAATQGTAEFGARRVCEVVGASRDAGARAIVDAIFEAVAAFRGAVPQHDDMTAVALRATT